ncbi:MAG TPA: hypothetical protein VKZ87_09475 [Ferrovibrio sp.]|uniref:hypothetical protein n=1 Tax=Ferrovibrio sp. TaxID=1917215 RepID=UPI002B4B4589|nr:hypothetical protein [Ferrovibrio sp.]HLT77605.1 hypothetical protein [Ferrovibrio sp.]
MTYLIDPTGRWWRWPSSVLAEQLGYPDPDFDLGAYAARNLGYVWVAPQDDATLLQFRAGMISMASVDALTPYLQKSLAAGKPVGLVFFASGWIEEAHTEIEPLVERLKDLSDYNEPHIRDLFIRQPHQPRDWLRDGQHELAGLFALWRAVGGLYSEPIETYLRRTGLVKRTVFVEPDGNDILLVKNSGAGFTVYDDFSFEYCVGRRLTDQPDKAYGRWIETTYRECLTSGDPVVDDVDAIVEQPGYDPRRRRYQRVILRWKTPDGRPLVTGSSLVTSISIPMDLSKI